MDVVNSPTTRARILSLASRRAAYSLVFIAGCAALWSGCGTLTSTSEQTQTAVSASTTQIPIATPTLGATPIPSPSTFSATAVTQLSVGLVSPIFSPDGSQILGSGQGGLNVGSADGTDLHAIQSDATYFAWSPDGKKIAATVVHGGLTSAVQPSDLVLMNADGSSPLDLGKSDFPAYFQVLPDGRLAFVRDAQLHLFDPITATDAIQADASPILNNAAAADVPFLVSDDASYVAVQSGTALSLQSLTTGATVQLTSSVDGRRLSGYGWSSLRALAYADVDSERNPSLHVYDPSTGSDRVVLHGSSSGVFAGVSWSTTRWLVFAFYPSGTVGEELSQYEALDTTTDTPIQLFTGGIGFKLSGAGQKLVFTRSQGTGLPPAYWVATLGAK